jgi:hypothetical protein
VPCQRLIRTEAPLRDEAILVRALFDSYLDGAAFDRDILITDASHNFDEFGDYGLSLWAVSDSWPLDRVLGEKTRTARRIALFSAGALRAQELGPVPSGWPPHQDTSLGAV